MRLPCFALPPLIFLLTYWFLYTLCKAKKLSILGGLLLSLPPHLGRVDVVTSIFTGFSKLWGFIPPILAEAQCFYCFSRSINSQLTFIFLLASLLFWAKTLITFQRKYILTHHTANVELFCLDILDKHLLTVYPPDG